MYPAELVGWSPAPASSYPTRQGTDAGALRVQDAESGGVDGIGRRRTKAAFALTPGRQEYSRGYLTSVRSDGRMGLQSEPSPCRAGPLAA